ncbi:MAG TPA: peptidylprolyl isomerase [Thermoanaerobaculia bacterium]|jgi:peptidyl-prolyl cis-trans isomerase A (cyclophilin A)|nr:peptidylprolyl isomerase [Thermoanaerobaculia bacterium]
MRRGPTLIVLLLAACAPLLLDPHDRRLNAHAPELFRVQFATSQGDFVVEVHRSWAPIGADRFYNLAAHGFFDGQRFFRVRQGVFAQFGIPGDPRVAQAWRSATIPDDPPRQSNVRGTIAYAFTTANTRATQVFINLADNRQFDPQGFAPFGVVTSGMEVVDRLYSGYGETAGGGMRAGHQDALFASGNTWLMREFPRLDYIRRARVE